VLEPYILSLNAHPKIGSQTIAKICHAFNNDLKKAWSASESVIHKKLDDKISGLFLEAREKYSPEDELNKMRDCGAGYITFWDKQYPKLLKEIPNAPAILYVRGDVEVLSQSSLAIVGSRKYTSYGIRSAQKLSHEISEAGLVVVSGLALGIDSVVHRANVDVHGKTIGVLACGVDTVYPSSNRQLAEQILEMGGAIISEYPCGYPPLKQNFPQRNRIIAGLSLGTLVVEAAEKSGALITAFLALEANREVFAVPGNIDCENSAGSNYLIQKGAKLVRNAEDVFEELNILIKLKKSEEYQPETEDESMVIQYLSEPDGLTIDELIRVSGLNIVSINMTLTILEMKGIVSNVGGRFTLS